MMSFLEILLHIFIFFFAFLHHFLSDTYKNLHCDSYKFQSEVTNNLLNCQTYSFYNHFDSCQFKIVKVTDHLVIY